MRKILYLGDNPDFFFGLTKENADYRLYAMETVEAALSAIAFEGFHLGI